MVLAPAKLNLFLEILGRRPDGYHEIETVVVAIDWRDRLTITRSDQPGVRLTCTDAELPTDDCNLVVRAGRRLLGAAGLDQHVGLDVHLEKHIPHQAGLGGGSSDAAAMLRATHDLLGLDWPVAKLETLASQIGSDVSFFLGGPSAICRGRGEAIEPFELPRSVAAGWKFVVVKPSVGLATAEVYRRLVGLEDAALVGGPLGGRAGRAAEVRDALISGDRARLAAELFNRLEQPADQMTWHVAAARATLRRAGARASCQTGSGSAVFGLADDDAHAAEVLRQFRELWPSVCRTHAPGEEVAAIQAQIVGLHVI